MRKAFEQAGATVCVIDLQENDCFVGDLSDKAVLEAFAEKVIADHGHVDCLINNAVPVSLHRLWGPDADQQPAA